jgi:phospholipase C
MQENLSFDHYFGTLSGVRGFDDPEALRLSNVQSVSISLTPKTRKAPCCLFIWTRMEAARRKYLLQAMLGQSTTKHGTAAEGTCGFRRAELATPTR